MTKGGMADSDDGLTEVDAVSAQARHDGCGARAHGRGTRQRQGHKAAAGLWLVIILAAFLEPYF